MGATDGEGNYVTTGASWTYFSPDYTINKGEVYHFTLKTYNNQVNIWDNFWLAITTDVNRPLKNQQRPDGYKEYLMMRPDNANGSAWQDNNAGLWFARQNTYQATEGKTFQQDVNGADVDITVLYDENNTFYVNMTITTESGQTFMHNAQATGADGNQCRLFLTVENAYIEITTAEKVSRIIENRAHLNSTNNWTLVTDADDLHSKATSGNYFFTIAGTRDDVTLALNTNSVNNDSHLAYKKSVNPVEDLSRLFYIEAATENEEEVYNLRNVEQSDYLMQTNNSQWKFAIIYGDQPITIDWANLDITYIGNAVCKLSWNKFKNDNIYFGAWDDNILPNNIPSGDDNVSQLASNKSGKGVGAFAIYAIKRSDFITQYIGESTNKDLTTFVINPKIECQGWGSRGKFLGWNSDSQGNGVFDRNTWSGEGTTDGSGMVTPFLQYHQGGPGSILGNKNASHTPIKGLKAGWYRVSALIRAFNEGSDVVPTGFNLYANEDISTTEGTEGTYVSNNVSSKIFYGTYTVDVYLNGEKDLVFGVKVENANFNWIAFKNFTLTYMGIHPLTDSRTTAAGKYGTVCLPYAAEATNAEIYTAAVNGNVVELTQARDGIEAGVPYVFKATEDHPSFSFTAGSEIVNTPKNEGVLKGSFEQVTVPVGAYVLQTQNGVQSFYKVYDGHQPSMGAYRAYLVAENNNARELTFGTDEETAIEALNALINGEAKIYDLNGRQLQQLQKGINIVNGKKFIVK